VLIVGKYAFKVARHGVGKRCNLYEAACYRSASPENQVHLCPALFCGAGGCFLLMRAAEPVGENEEIEYPTWDYTPLTDGCPWESKPADFGWFEGRLVAVDYATPAM
jgi:hypothetical protein